MDSSDPRSQIRLVLSDSALPLGSFAFSSGLESYMSHNNLRSKNSQHAVTHFLSLSVRSLASAVIPMVIAAYTKPESAAILDDEIEAATTCNVARRSSTCQGRALLTVWDKSLSSRMAVGSIEREWMEGYKIAVKSGDARGHFGIVWGLVCRAFSLQLDEVCYIFMFNHVKAVLSAAVRLGLIGPYHAQAILILHSTQELIIQAIHEGNVRSSDQAGQIMPILDIYEGRHELLYSRVFNS